MPLVTYVDPRGNRRTVAVACGESVMQGAQNSMIEGIIGECGGSCACGTCHCYVDANWIGKLPAAGDSEIATLECAIDVRPESRLSCQIVMTDELDGLVVQVPEAQL